MTKKVFKKKDCHREERLECQREAIREVEITVERVIMVVVVLIK